MRDRARHKVARVTLKRSPQPSRLAAQRRRGGATLDLAVVFRGSPGGRRGLERGGPRSSIMCGLLKRSLFDALASDAWHLRYSSSTLAS